MTQLLLAALTTWMGLTYLENWRHGEGIYPNGTPGLPWHDGTVYITNKP